MSSDRALPGRRRQRAWRREAARLAAWRRVDAQLELATRTAREWPARWVGRRPAGPPLELAPGERPLAVLTALALVEVFRAPGRNHSGYGTYSARGTARLRHRLPLLPAETQRVLAHGPATVTNRRIVFHGPKQCTEWPFEAVLRVEHARRRPVTLLHVDGRSTVLGLLYRVPDAGPVRLVIELALAGHRGDLRPVLAGLAADRGRHARDRPRSELGQAPLPAAEPERSPAWAAN